MFQITTTNQPIYGNYFDKLQYTVVTISAYTYYNFGIYLNVSRV